MASHLVSQHQLSSYATPQNGDPGDATVVLGNDNTTVTGYNSHDADGTIHVQSTSAATFNATPAGTEGRKWMTQDAGAVYLYLDTGSAWVEVNYLRNTGGTVTGNLAVTGNAAVTGNITAGTVFTLAPASGTLTLDNGAVANAILSMNGTANSGEGVEISFARGGMNKGYLGTQSLIRGGTSDTIVLQAAVGVDVAIYANNALNATFSATGLALNSLALSGVTSVTIASGTITASAPAISTTQTWNNAAVAFVGTSLNVTNTASLGKSAGVIGSLLARWQLGGSDRALLTKDGTLILGTVATAMTSLSGSTYVSGDGGLACTGFTAFRAGGPPAIRLGNIGGSFASPSAITSGTELATIAFDGSDSTTTTGTSSAFSTVPTIRSFATENWSTTAHGSKVVISVVPNITIVQASAVVFDQDLSATFGGIVITPATTATVAGLRLPHGTAPSVPTNGDVWTTSASAFVRINGTTMDLRGAAMFTQTYAGATAAAGTTYGCPSASSTNATEANRQIVVLGACVMRSFYVVTSGAQPGDGAAVWTLRKNGVDTTVTLTIAAGAAAGTFSDTTHSVSFAAGDLLSWKVANASASPSATIIAAGIMPAPV